MILTGIDSEDSREGEEEVHCSETYQRSGAEHSLQLHVHTYRSVESLGRGVATLNKDSRRAVRSEAVKQGSRGVLTRKP